MTGKPESINHLKDGFYITPTFARQVMTTKHVRETLESTQGYVLSLGENWRIVVRSIGAGMYEVTLDRTWKLKSKKKEVKTGDRD